MSILQLKRGLESNRLSLTPAEGELLYTTDNKQLYVGDGITAGGKTVGSELNVISAGATYTAYANGLIYFSIPWSAAIYQTIDVTLPVALNVGNFWESVDQLNLIEGAAIGITYTLINTTTLRIYNGFGNVGTLYAIFWAY